MMLWLAAARQPCEIMSDAGTVHLEQGQLLYSSRHYGEQMGVSPATAYRTLKSLEEKRLVHVHVKHPHAIVTICDYLDYNKARKRPATATKPKARNTWMTPFGDIWLDRYGGEMSYKQAARPLRRLVEQHGQESVLKSFTRYCDKTDAEFASVPKFCSTYGRWNGSHRPSKPRGWTWAWAVVTKDPDRDKRPVFDLETPEGRAADTALNVLGSWHEWCSGTGGNEVADRAAFRDAYIQALEEGT